MCYVAEYSCTSNMYWFFFYFFHQDKNGRIGYLYNGECKRVCPQGYFTFENTCVQCPENCEFCKSQTKCDKCLESFFPVNGACQELECPEGTSPGWGPKCIITLCKLQLFPLLSERSVRNTTCSKHEQPTNEYLLLVEPCCIYTVLKNIYISVCLCAYKKMISAI